MWIELVVVISDDDMWAHLTDNANKACKHVIDRLITKALGSALSLESGIPESR